MKVFISYAHADIQTALAVQQSLDIHEVWFDNHLSVGQDWWQEIERQISAAHCFLFLMSPESLASEYCQKEIDVALRLAKPIAPVMITQVDIPERLARFQVISIIGGMTPENVIRLINGLFEIERQVFNPLHRPKGTTAPSARLAIDDLYFATTNNTKKQMYEQILNVRLQTAPIQLADIQHLDTGEVALEKAKRAHDVLQKPVFVDHSGLAIRAWGGLPGGLSTTVIVAAGLHTLCKMLDPFNDRYAEAISVIAFMDGIMRRKFVGVVPGEIATVPRGAGYSWHNIFIPAGFDKTLGEMSEEEMLSISSRRRAVIDFMRFLQSTYEVV